MNTLQVKEVNDMRVSATERKMNMGKYIGRAALEGIIITRHGKDVAILTNVEGQRPPTETSPVSRRAL